MVELMGHACRAAGQPFSTTAARGVLLLGGSRLAQVSVGAAWSPIVTEDTAALLIGLEVGEALRAAKYCAHDAVALVDALVLPPVAPRDPRPYPGPAEIEPALKEVLRLVVVADFGALCTQAAAPSDRAYAFLVGAASRLKGLDLLRDAWTEALEEAKAPEGERLAFAAGAAWAAKAGL